WAGGGPRPPRRPGPSEGKRVGCPLSAPPQCSTWNTQVALPSVQECSTWNIARPTLPSSYPQPLTLPTLHLISTFRRPIRVLHSFSNENFGAAALRHCRPPTPRSKLLESASPAQPWDASSQSPTRRAESARPRPPSTWRRRSPPSAPARCWSIAIPSPTPP